MFTTIPTIMTWARIFAIPLIVGVFYLPEAAASQAERNLIATVMFVVFALTDWLDGWLARKLNQTSAFGAFLDPVADKFLVCATLLVLVHLQRTDVFVALIIIGREIAISALREWMAKIGAARSVAVHMLGKLKTTFQMVANKKALQQKLGLDVDPNALIFGVVSRLSWQKGLDLLLDRLPAMLAAGGQLALSARTGAAASSAWIVCRSAATATPHALRKRLRQW